MALKTNKVNWIFLINGRVFLKKLGLMLVFHMMIFNWLGKKTYLLFGCWTLLCTLGNRNYIWTMNMHSACITEVYEYISIGTNTRFCDEGSSNTFTIHLKTFFGFWLIDKGRVVTCFHFKERPIAKKMSVAAWMLKVFYPLKTFLCNEKFGWK